MVENVIHHAENDTNEQKTFSCHKCDLNLYFVFNFHNVWDRYRNSFLYKKEVFKIDIFKVNPSSNSIDYLELLQKE